MDTFGTKDHFTRTAHSLFNGSISIFLQSSYVINVHPIHYAKMQLDKIKFGWRTLIKETQWEYMDCTLFKEKFLALRSSIFPLKLHSNLYHTAQYDFGNTIYNYSKDRKRSHHHPQYCPLCKINWICFIDRSAALFVSMSNLESSGPILICKL